MAVIKNTPKEKEEKPWNLKCLVFVHREGLPENL